MINETIINKDRIRWKSQSSRKAKDRVALGFSYAALLLMAGILISIFAYILGNGATHVTLTMLTTNGNSTTGGLRNALVGTWLLVAVGLIFSVPSGVFGALYLVNSTSNGVITRTVRFLTDILTSIPSIILGLFGYFVLVIRLGFGYSLLAGGITLGIMMLPYIVRITELSYRNVPKSQVESAYALGADSMSVAARIYLPQSMAGILSAILLAVSIAAGETAQLLYTTSYSLFFPTGLTGISSATGYLTYVVWFGIETGTKYSVELAYVAAMILILTMALLITGSKYIQNKKR